MNPTSGLFQAFLKCPTKCHLRSVNEVNSGNAYAGWVQAQDDGYREKGTKWLMQGVPEAERVVAPPLTDGLETATWRLAVDVRAVAAAMESQLHAVERVPSKGQSKPAQFIPVRFVFFNKLTKRDRLSLAFDALVLSEALGREISLGKIIHGDDHAVLKVRVAGLLAEVRKLFGKLTTLLATGSPPDLILNRHCAECEFQARCRQKTIEADDLSLLSGMKEGERTNYHSKGIFTVKQLSYTFRPRRTPKRVKNPTTTHNCALKALAIRENTIYIHGNPQIPESKTQVYLDIEGLPDRDFYYLIGALFVSASKEKFYSFWAENKSDEPRIFARFADIISRWPDFRVLHYGSYETTALKRLQPKLSQFHRSTVDAILKHATNVLSLIHPHIYLPTYSNSLKEIGRFLGCHRTNEDATGLQTIAWRQSWEVTRKPDLKASLLKYNQEDCRTLRRVSKLIVDLTLRASTVPALQGGLPATRTEEMIKGRPHWELFRPKEYALEDFKHLCKCAYFDYQREKVLVRTDPQLPSVNKKHRRLKRTKISPNTVVEIECRHCPRCQRKSIEKTQQLKRFLIDLKFSGTGVKKWITQFHSYRYKCLKCGHKFHSEARSAGGQYRYGHGMMSWCVYMSFFCDMKMSRTRIALGDTFGIFVDDSRMMRSRNIISHEYEPLYDAIFQSLLKENVLHVDETSVKLVGSKGYVWVLASKDRVYYLYKPSREGAFLQEMLRPFAGVLVSDFYTAYDSLLCEQQKCLVHFVRDIDDDLLRNPLDTELKTIAKEFGTLLRTVIQTVDHYGLKARHLRKHKPAVLRFLDSISSKEFISEVCGSYQKRFQKSGAKMFTFLDYDGVPWNNTNAEHAIKRFAKFRTHANGRFTERSLKEYLVLVSIFQTCEFNNMNVLRFLLSKEMTLEELLKNAGRKSSPVASDPQAVPLSPGNT